MGTTRSNDGTEDRITLTVEMDDRTMYLSDSKWPDDGRFRVGYSVPLPLRSGVDRTVNAKVVLGLSKWQAVSLLGELATYLRTAEITQPTGDR